MSPKTLIRKHIFVQGRVQGVGFRAFTQYTAQGLGLTGWVRNVGYDRVEILAEGTQDQMDRFIADVSQGPRSSAVESVTVDDEPVSGEFTYFDITG